MTEDRFRQAKEQFLSLKGQLAVRRISRAQYQAALQQLVVQDAQGRHWTIHPDSGRWLVYNGDAWLEATPPSTSFGWQASPQSQSPVGRWPSPTDWTAVPQPPAQSASLGGMSWLVPASIVGIGLIFFSLVLIVLFASGALTFTQTALVPTATQAARVLPVVPQVVTATPIPAGATVTRAPATLLSTMAVPAPRTLSRDQRFLVASLGNPTSFSLNMVPQNVAYAAGVTQYETWYYASGRVSFTFMNGAYVGSDDLEPLAPGVNFPSVRPEQFPAGLSLPQVAAVIGEQPIDKLQIPDALIPTAAMYKFKGVLAGFQADRLVYLQTVPYVIKTSSIDLASNLLASVKRTDSPAQFSFMSLRTARPSVYEFPRGELGLAPPAAGEQCTGPGASASSECRNDAALIEFYGTTDRGQWTVDDAREAYKGAADALEEQAKKFREQAKTVSDPMEKAKLEYLAKSSEQTAQAIHSEVLQSLDPIKYKPGYSSILELQNRVTKFVEEPNKVYWNVVDNITRNYALRPGQIRGDTKDFLEYMGSGSVPLTFDEKTSLIIEILQQKVSAACADQKADREKYDVCAWTTVNKMKEDVRNWAGSETCYEYVKNAIWSKTWSYAAPPGENLVFVAFKAPRVQNAAQLAQQTTCACPPRGTDLKPGGT